MPWRRNMDWDLSFKNSVPRSVCSKAHFGADDSTFSKASVTRSADFESSGSTQAFFRIIRLSPSVKTCTYRCHSRYSSNLTNRPDIDRQFLSSRSCDAENELCVVCVTHMRPARLDIALRRRASHPSYVASNSVRNRSLLANSA